MAPHSSTLAWKIPWMEEPGRLQSMGSQSQTWLSDFHFTLWGSHIFFLFFPVVAKSFHSGFPGGSDGKESACSAEDPGSIPELGRSAGEAIGYPLQYSGLENSMDCIVPGVTKSRTRLRDFHFQTPKSDTGAKFQGVAQKVGMKRDFMIIK